MLDIKTLAAAKKTIEKINNNDELNIHTKNSNIHITSEEREKWNKDFNDHTPTFIHATSRENIASGEKLSIIFGKIKKWFADLKSVAFTADYNDLINKPEPPEVIRVKGDAENSYRVGDVNITKENIGLGNVDNTSDANKRVASAVNADTLNGKHDSDFFRFTQHPYDTIAETLREEGIHKASGGYFSHIDNNYSSAGGLSNIIVFNDNYGFGNVQLGILNPVSYDSPSKKNLVYIRAQISYGNDWTNWLPLGNLIPIVLFDGERSIRGDVFKISFSLVNSENYYISVPNRNFEIFHMRIIASTGSEYVCEEFYLYSQPTGCSLISPPIKINTKNIETSEINSEYISIGMELTHIYDERIVVIDGRFLGNDIQLYRLEILAVQ